MDMRLHSINIDRDGFCTVFIYTCFLFLCPCLGSFDIVLVWDLFFVLLKDLCLSLYGSFAILTHTRPPIGGEYALLGNFKFYNKYLACQLIDPGLVLF